MVRELAKVAFSRSAVGEQLEHVIEALAAIDTL